MVLDPYEDRKPGTRSVGREVSTGAIKTRGGCDARQAPYLQHRL